METKFRELQLEQPTFNRIDGSCTSSIPRWTAESWLVSNKSVLKLLAARLLQHAPPGGTEADRITRLSPELIKKAVNDYLPDLEQEIIGGVSRLNTCVQKTALALNTKFTADENSFTFVYGGIETFYGGLQAHLGNPNAKILWAMEQEHASSVYAHRSFMCWGVFKSEHTTTALVEWNYVTNVGGQLARELGKREEGHDGWSLDEYISRNGNNCVLILTGTGQPVLTGKLVHTPVLVSSMGNCAGDLLVEVSFVDLKFQNGLDLETDREYPVRLLADGKVIAVQGNKLKYSTHLVPGYKYEVKLHGSNKIQSVDGGSLKWSKSTNMIELTSDAIALSFLTLYRQHRIPC
jgi:hypothetical protein